MSRYATEEMEEILGLVKRLSDLRLELVGTRYEDCYGGRYVVSEIAMSNEIGEFMIMYKSCSNPNLVWCKSLSAFNSEMKRVKLTDFKEELHRRVVESN